MGGAQGFSALLGAQAVGVGALTSLIGAGGGFVIMPALTLLGALRAWRCPTSLTKDSTLMYGEGTRRVRLVRGEGRGVST